VALGSHQLIDVGDLPPALRSQQTDDLPLGEGDSLVLAGANSDSDTDLEELERATIQRVFEQVDGDKSLARKMLGISRATLYRKLKRYNIERKTAISS